MNLSLINDKSRSEKRKETDLALSVFNNKHSIRIFAILTAQNPVTTKATSSYNKKANKSLRSILDKYSSTYVPVKGKFGGNIENFYFVINPKFEAIQKLAEKFNQSSFLYGEVYDDRFEVKSYQLQDPDKPFSSLSNNFEYLNTTSDYFASEDAVDNYSQIASKLKFAFPSELFEKANALADAQRDITDSVIRQAFFHIGAYANNLYRKYFQL